MLNIFKGFAPKKTLSVIIPVYNAAIYLEECLISVLNHVDSKIEVIAVDDASDDNSYEILLKYRKSNPYLKVFQNKSNLGPGQTRNLGLRKTTGKYVAFVDSDDTVSETYFSDMIFSAEKNNSDIVFSNAEPKRHAIERIFNKYYPVSTSLGDLPAEGTSAVWGKLFRNSFLENNNIHFISEKIIIGEDLPFSFISYFCAQTISFAPRATYCYRMHGAGLDSANNEVVLSIFIALKYVRSIYKKLDPLGSREQLIVCLLVKHVAYNYTKLVRARNPDMELIDNYKAEAKSILAYPSDLIMNNKYLEQDAKDFYIELNEENQFA